VGNGNNTNDQTYDAPEGFGPYHDPNDDMPLEEVTPLENGTLGAGGSY
jgi:hypothetical protein